MKQYFPSAGLGKLCGLFGKTRQAFYDHGWHSGDEALQEAFIINRVKQIREQVEGIGGLQLHHMLKEEMQLYGMYIGRDHFYELLRKHDLLVKEKSAIALQRIPTIHITNGLILPVILL